MKPRIALMLVLISFIPFRGISQLKTQNLIIVTIDGCRWQEVFTGADSSIIKIPAQVNDPIGFSNRYWDSDPLLRRKKLMPFLWSTVASEGIIMGNRLYNNRVNVTNHMWFSYPGYNEILCGFADDVNITSNDPLPNPNTTVLEFINKSNGFEGKVAAYSSWDAFPYIINEERSGIPVNAAFEKVSGKGLTENEIFMNKIMRMFPEFISGVRNDAFTFYLGFEYLKRNRPRVLYLALDETDDLGHAARYDLYMNAIAYTDQMIAEMWNWIQHDPQYKNKTTLLITIDHGRGKGTVEWQSHGSKTPSSDETWFAVIGPDTPSKGENKESAQYYNNQYAKSLAALLGLNYSNRQPVGEIIPEIVGK